jgi:hypothetical protein
MSYLQTLLENLKKEIPYQWRIQSKTKNGKAICSAYIDARDTMKVLDSYCTYGWQTDVKELAGFIFYGIGVNVPLSGDENEEEELVIQTMWRWDTGARIENNATDQMYDQAGKSAASDAFKRAAVQWGVGRFLYDLDTVMLPFEGYNVVDDQGQKVYDLTTYINNRKKGFKTTTSTAPVTNSAPPSIPATNTAPEPVKDDAKKLPQEAFDSMVKFIADGKIKEVETAMKKYNLTPQQKTVLTTLINQERAKAITSSAKKK